MKPILFKSVTKTFLYRDLVGRPEGNNALRIHWLGLQDNILTDLQEVEWRTWTGLIWLKVGVGGTLL